MKDKHFIPLKNYQVYPPEEMHKRSLNYFQQMNTRRTVRHFSDREVPREVIENCLRTAGTAPSGAHKQPWFFGVVSDPKLKKEIREAAEAEEREFYESRATSEWLAVLEPLGTTADKSFLETAPYLIVIYAQRFSGDNDNIEKNYYVQESVGIATGMLISAVHNAGLVSLTHTPSPMGFLNRILGRPKNERPFLILVVGYPDHSARVPDLKRKALGEICKLY